MKTGPRLIQKAKAQKLLQQVIEEEMVDHELTVFALINLCELLLDELKCYGEEEVLQQVNFLLNQMSEIAYKQQSAPRLVQTLLLQARFSLLEGEATRADQLLKEAREVCEDKGLLQLQSQITQEQENLRNEMEKWDALIARSAPLKERIEEARLTEYISKAIQILPKTS